MSEAKLSDIQFYVAYHFLAFHIHNRLYCTKISKICIFNSVLGKLPGIAWNLKLKYGTWHCPGPAEFENLYMGDSQKVGS